MVVCWSIVQQVQLQALFGGSLLQASHQGFRPEDAPLDTVCLLNSCLCLASSLVIGTPLRQAVILVLLHWTSLFFETFYHVSTTKQDQLVTNSKPVGKNLAVCCCTLEKEFHSAACLRISRISLRSRICKSKTYYERLFKSTGYYSVPSRSALSELCGRSPLSYRATGTVKVLRMSQGASPCEDLGPHATVRDAAVTGLHSTI